MALLLLLFLNFGISLSGQRGDYFHISEASKISAGFPTSTWSNERAQGQACLNITGKQGADFTMPD